MHVISILVLWVTFKVTEQPLFSCTPPAITHPHIMLNNTLWAFVSSQPFLLCVYAWRCDYHKQNQTKTQWILSETSSGLSATNLRLLVQFRQGSEVTYCIMGARPHPGVTVIQWALLTGSKTFQRTSEGNDGVEGQVLTQPFTRTA